MVRQTGRGEETLANILQLRAEGTRGNLARTRQSVGVAAAVVVFVVVAHGRDDTKRPPGRFPEALISLELVVVFEPTTCARQAALNQLFKLFQVDPRLPYNRA